MLCIFVFFNDPATTQIYTFSHTPSRLDALPICCPRAPGNRIRTAVPGILPATTATARLARNRFPDISHHGATNARAPRRAHRCRRPVNRSARVGRSEEHTSELQSLMRISYAVFCLKKKKKQNNKKRRKRT